MKTLAERVFDSSVLLLLTRLVQRGIGVVSMLILARILEPADFGMIAIVLVVIQFFEIVSAVGTEQYIIQKSKVGVDDLNTAWTIRLLTNVALWLVLFASAPLIADYFDKPDLVFALRICSLVLVMNSLCNPGVMLLKKNLTYGKILKLSVVQKLAGFSAVMLVVFQHPSYWALITGALVSSASFAIGSYVIHPHRPSPCLSRFREQFGFSQWMLYRSFFGFTHSQIDTILITKSFSLTDAGAFHLVKTLTAMPANDIVVPAVTPLLSAFSQVKSNLLDLALKFRVGLVFVVSLVVPVCVFMAVFSEVIVDVFLGEKWTRAYTIFPVMAPLLFVLSVSRVYESVCLALGRVRDLFIYNVITTVILVSVLILLRDASLETFVLNRTLIHLVIVLIFPLYISRFLKVDTLRIVLLCIPALSSAIAAGLLASWIEAYLPSLAPVRLIGISVAFFTTYAVTITTTYCLFFGDAAEFGSVRALFVKLLARNRHQLRVDQG
ncbi:oligosaccharide flippase family protein [Granulosicoccus sp.]|nr:oligosaccharide flippase family protein [Granulosicoccus sp.]